MLEPIPETREALAELVTLEDPQLDDVLARMARRAQAIVPELVGLSVGMVQEELTFTLVASNSALASLDGAQYLDDGPCVEAVGTAPRDIETEIDDLLDEGRWQLFAEASAAAGIASSLSMPIRRHDKVIGSVNLYASTPDAFTGRHEQLALALDTDPATAITNADLSFSTRLRAAEAPSRIRDAQTIDTAVGVLSALFGIGLDVAQERLRKAAARAGIQEALLARVLLLVQSD
jgi:GAF domain-containing protein